MKKISLKIRTGLKAGFRRATPQPLYGIKPMQPLYGIMPLYAIMPVGEAETAD